MTWVARALEREETAGLMKIVVDAETDRILGANPHVQILAQPYEDEWGMPSRLITDYETLTTELCAKLTPANHHLAVGLANIPQKIRGFGHVKARNLERTRSVEEIRENGYDLSINRYKEVAYEEAEYEKPEVIIGRLRALEQEIISDLDELEALLRTE